MYPYSMREAEEPRRNALEIGAAVAGMIILAACAISDVPRPGLLTSAARTKEPGRSGPSTAALQTATQQLQMRDTAIEADVAALTRLLQGARAELASLKEQHSTLEAQVTTTVAKLQKLETAVQESSARLANAPDPKVLLQATKDRDEALAQSKQSDEQVRQLTLKLQRAGLYP